MMDNIDSFLQVGTAKNPFYSPVKQTLCFIYNFNGFSKIWEFDGREARFSPLSFLENTIKVIDFVEKSANLIIGIDPDGSEKQQLYLIKNRDLIPLTNSPEHVHRYGGSSPDGKWIAWSSNRRNPAFFDIYTQNIKTMEIRLVYAQDSLFTAIKWSPDGKSLLIQKVNSPLDNDLGILNLSTREVNWITPHEGEASFRDAHFNKEGDHLYLLSNKDREFYGLALINLSTKDFNWLELGEWDFESLSMNQDKNKLAYTMNAGGISKGFILDLDRSYLSRWKTPIGVISKLKFSPDNKKLAYEFDGPAFPPHIRELDLTTLQSKRIIHFSRNPILENELIEPELISFKSFDNLTIPAFFFKPKQVSEKLPVVFYIHGGPESQSRAVYQPILQYFLKMGYSVCTPNVRGSSGYGKTYTHLDDVRKRMDAVEDLVYLAKWLQENRNIDLQKIAIMGGSYGGFIVLAAISHYPHLWRGAIDIVGMSSLKTFLEKTSPWRKRQRELEYGTIQKDSDFFDKIDPLHHTDRITAPLLVIHGVNDVRVPIEESEQIVNKLMKRKHPVSYLRLENEGHIISKQKNKIKVYTEIATFLEKYLGKGSG